MNNRVAKCGRVRVDDLVEVVRSPDSTYFSGIMTCNSTWECPVCVAKQRREAAAELNYIVKRWGQDGDGNGSAYLVTFTVRHHLGESLAELRKALATMWTRFCAGREFQAFAARGVQLIRALDVTHGPHGWHPHLHVLVLTADELGEDEVYRIRTWMFERWRGLVEWRLGADHVPDVDLGLDFRPAKDGEYIARLGLEMTDAVRAKQAKPGHRTPFQILEDACDGDADSIRLYQQYARDMKGASFLTMSRAGYVRWLREEWKQLQAAELAAMEVQTYALLGSTWDALRDLDGWALGLLDAFEAGGADACAAHIERGWSTLRARPPPGGTSGL